MVEFNKYFSGETLYGDDLTPDEILDWFSDEAEGYAGLGAADTQRYAYGYHQFNYIHAFRYIKKRHFDNALGIGSAYGDEFKPISKQISHITILDPSDAFADVNEISGVPCTYKKPAASGDIPFRDGHFELITCLGVLHHIPNVSHVLSECARCLDKGGIMLLREPINSMGDWRFPRSGLTKRERGIPVHLMDQIIEKASFTTLLKAVCNFPLLPIITEKVGVDTYNSSLLTRLDQLLSNMFSWNITYHRTSVFKKLAPHQYIIF
jgi:2-polyprenyl-3-methyl-5-hydroxy-6-metoxy-1,4-benzoquinol methylase